MIIDRNMTGVSSLNMTPKHGSKTDDPHPFGYLKAWPEVGAGPFFQGKCQIDEAIGSNIEHGHDGSHHIKFPDQNA